MDLHVRLFPAVYTNGDRPPKYGAIAEGASSPTPAYAFGWIVSSVELFEALNIIDEPPLKLWLNHLPEIVDDRIHDRWQSNGYEDYNYNPITPEAKRIGEDYILIYMACNESQEVMDRITVNKAYHDECRDCLNNPKPMRMEPAWFRAGLRGMPKGFMPEHQEDGGRLQRCY